jgi:non-homologous end joining protein Ku
VFDPASFRDRYQDALRELAEAKTKGLATTPRAVTMGAAFFRS